ncbi:hypothetical protein [Flavobacterium ginsenosidimutans]|uniref:hypothetical protein n=1 Tax=Flavobacterium ginsenosidimutans TaxID=687844 RepID=UPI003D98BF98
MQEQEIEKKLNHQGFNGNIGEQRTSAILAKDFLVSTISVDIEGRDFMVEEMPSSHSQIQESKKRITCRGIVQAKYFENNNEVKIARQYVEDTDGVKTDFFAILHTDDINRKEFVYFFTAREIQKNFYLRTDGNKDYYIFRLTAKKKFLRHRNIPSHKINQIIKDEISRTEEFRNEEFIRRITEKWFNPTGTQKYSNAELFDSIKGLHIVDKLYTTLNSYNDFRRVHGWRLGDKLSFYDKINTATYYSNFTLRTNNRQIIDFFLNIKIGKTVEIKNLAFFNGVSNVMEKINAIIIKLNQGNIKMVETDIAKINIVLKKPKNTNSSIHAYRSLNFYQAEKSAAAEKETLGWEMLQSAFTMFNLGKLDQAKIIITEALDDAVDNKEYVLSFVCRFNLHIIGHYIYDENEIHLYTELLRLAIPAEKREILKFVSEQTLLNSYLKQIDDAYLKIKDYQQRQHNNSTLELLNMQRTKIIECLGFYRGNRFVFTEEFDELLEKYIESCIISYSMRTPHRNHLGSFDDFIIESILLHCDSQKLLQCLQRNNLFDISYLSESDNYYPNAVLNFFSQENIAYLKHEIRSVDGRYENYKLRRKTIRIFNNICILITFVEAQYDPQLVHMLFSFVSELSLSSDECSYLAHPISVRTTLFGSADLIVLIRILLDKDDNRGYLLTNCLFALKDRNYLIQETCRDIIDPIADLILEQPDFHTLRAFSKVLQQQDLDGLTQRIESRLASNFDARLYHEAAVCGCLPHYQNFCEAYSTEITAVLNRKNPMMLQLPSTITGLSPFVSSRIADLVEVLYSVGQNAIAEETLLLVKKVHPYYKFLIDIENFKQGDPFELNWLLEHRSHIILQKLARSEALIREVKKEVNGNTHINILKIYFQYFSKY